MSSIPQTLDISAAQARRGRVSNPGESTADEAFHVPKHKVMAQVILQGHPPFTVWLYISERAENHFGCERPSDLLNNPNEFLPVSDEDDRLILLQKDALMLIAVPAEYEAGASYPEEVELAGLTITQGLELLLIDGTALRGTVTYLRPDGGQRLQDFLNTADNFIAIRDNEMVQLVSRKCIASISPALEPTTYPRRRAEDS